MSPFLDWRIDIDRTFTDALKLPSLYPPSLSRSFPILYLTLALSFLPSFSNQQLTEAAGTGCIVRVMSDRRIV